LSLMRHRTAPSCRPGALVALAFAALLVASGCATRPNPGDAEAVAEFRVTNDPLEPLNRGLFFVNDGIDTLLLRPAAEAYRIFLPPEVRTAIRNILGNLRTPVILVNDLLQGETQRAATTMGRFIVNTTLGVGGIFDMNQIQVSAVWTVNGTPRNHVIDPRNTSWAVDSSKSQNGPPTMGPAIVEQRFRP